MGNYIKIVTLSRKFRYGCWCFNVLILLRGSLIRSNTMLLFIQVLKLRNFLVSWERVGTGNTRSSQSDEQWLQLLTLQLLVSRLSFSWVGSQDGSVSVLRGYPRVPRNLTVTVCSEDECWVAGVDQYTGVGWCHHSPSRNDGVSTGLSSSSFSLVFTNRLSWSMLEFGG